MRSEHYSIFTATELYGTEYGVVADVMEEAEMPYIPEIDVTPLTNNPRYVSIKIFYKMGIGDSGYNGFRRLAHEAGVVSDRLRRDAKIDIHGEAFRQQLHDQLALQAGKIAA